jgi:signal transduction histidine kinase
MKPPEPTVFAFRSWVRRQQHHILFGAMLVALSALLVWWAWFFHSTIQDEYHLNYQNLQLQARLTALRLGADTGRTPPRQGVYLWDSRLEIVKPATGDGVYRLRPRWTDRGVRLRPVAVRQLQRKYQRRVMMLTGEGLFLALCMLIFSIMLHRIILLERRSKEELKEFWSRITHEIKTPITGLKAFLETLKKREFSRKELLPLLDLAMSQVQRQERLAANLLRGQQMEAGAFRIEVSVLEWTPLIEDFFEEDDFQLTDSQISLALLSPAQSRVQGNPSVVREILNNLTDNAIKYSQPPLSLQVMMEENKDFLVLRVTDNGQGFPPEMAEKLFESYRHLRHELPQGINGTGMGLYLSRKLARRMGGELRASSPGQGEGATFSLWLKKAPHQAT